MTTKANFTAEFLDTETDDIVDVWMFSASDMQDAESLAEIEAEYQGFYLGTVRAI